VRATIGKLGAVVLLDLALLWPSAAGAQVRVSEGTLDLPTDEEGAPDVNPPFDLLATRNLNYPYTLRESLTGRQAVVRYRALYLENEYLKLIVLPDLGGHLYTCVDKTNGAEMFYANRSIRKAQIGYRGAWAAYGVEFNFPVSHNWVSVSPVDFATMTDSDGSASIWVGNVDRPYGMEWRVELKLRPGSARLEQNVALYNRSPVRRRFYWWNNAAVRVRDESRIYYPMRWTASHGFREVDTWPTDSTGVDLSRVGNHLYGPVSLFSHGSREAFMGVYHPWSKAGVVHFSSPEDAPTKKIWSWGGDADGLDWRRALSDDQSAYVEIQAGLFRNQETYGLMEPQQSVRFTEYWMPVRGIGGITRANPDAVLHLERKAESVARSKGMAAQPETVSVAFGVNDTRTVQGGTVRLKDGDRVVHSEPLTLTPAEVLIREVKQLPARARYTLELADAGGRLLLTHTEDDWDFVPPSEIRVGPQPAPKTAPLETRGDGDFIEAGEGQERDGKLLPALETYRQGLGRFPESVGLLKAAGRVEVTLKQSDTAVGHLTHALARVSNDPEVQYYLGLARVALGDDAKARAQFEGAQILAPFRPAARLELAKLEARAGDLEGALREVRAVVNESPDAVRAGGIEVVLLRRLGRESDARARLMLWRRSDPTNNLLWHEAVTLGGEESGLWRHLAGDPERVLDVAEDYIGLGLYDEAAALLARRYPSGEGVTAEAGTVLPQENPLVAYYRGYCRARAGGSGEADYRAASLMSTRYVFPSRAGTQPVLRAALATAPEDATAHFLLGSLLLSAGRVDEALAEWQETRRLNPRVPVLHRNLGMTLLHARGDARGALEAFVEGMGVDGSNGELYAGADQAQSLLALPTDDHVRMLERYPDRAAMPPVLVEKLALALAEAGRAEEAEPLFAGRFFPREESGTNVRQVYLEVRLRRAESLAKAGHAREAVSVLEALDRPVAGLDFTRDGMGAFVDGGRVQFLVGDILAACGRTNEARVHWGRAAQGHDWPYLQPVHALLAAERLGGGDKAASRQNLETNLARTQELLERGTGFPGLATYAQGLLLRALGREAEAEERFKSVFLLPDQRLAHFLSRRALEAHDPL
jgi:tetratricopeptide (TPR) repeat protein